MLRLVINLDKSTDRLDLISAQLRRDNLSFERISAIDGLKLSEDQINDITFPLNHFDSKVRFTRALTNGEIGCFLSHRKCWETLVKSNQQWALILEDDIQIAPKARAYLASPNWIPPDVRICQISNLMPSQIGRIDSFERPIDNFLSIVKPRYPTPLGTQAYFISRDCAMRALELSSKLPAPVDDFLFSPWFKISHEFELWKTSPILVIPSRNSASEIGNRSKKCVKKAKFWIRHGLTRFLLDLEVKRFQRKGRKFVYQPFTDI